MRGSQRRSAPPAAPAAAAADVLVLNNFTLIDGRGGPAVPNSALVATDGRISWIGPAAELKAPAGAPVQDLAGKFVMPGLIDLHTHVSNSDVEMQDPVRFFTREGVTRDLQLYASYGTTSVASLGTDQKPLVYEMREEQRKGRPKVARIFTAGRGFTVKDGFPTNKGNVPGIPYEPVTPAEAAAQMEELAAERPDVVKIWVDDRFGDFKKTPIEISRPIIDGAHKHGIKAIAHVFYLSDAKQLAAAGLDAFGHSVRDRAVDDELIQLMKKHGTWIIPTLYREWATFMFEDPGPLLGDPFFARALDEPAAGGPEVARVPQGADGRQIFSEVPGVLKNGEGKSEAAGGRRRAHRLRHRQRRADPIRGIWRAHGARADGRGRDDAGAGHHRGDQELGRVPRAAEGSGDARTGQVGGPDRARRRPAREHPEQPANRRGIRRREQSTVTITGD